MSKSFLKHFDFYIIDVLSVILSLIISFFIRHGNFDLFANEMYRSILFFIPILMFICDIVFNEYSNILRRGMGQELIITSQIATKNLICALAVLWIFKIGEHISRIVIILTYLIFVIISYLWKLLYKAYLGNKNKNDWDNFLIVGDYKAEVKCHNIKEFDKTKILELIKNDNINEIFFVNKPENEEEFLKFLVNNGIKIIFNKNELFPFYMNGEKLFNNLENIETISVSIFEFSNKQIFYFFIKRIFDIICSLIGCALLIPLLIIVKILYLKDGDKAPIVYVQERVGKNRKIFKLYKIRTMVVNAEEKLQEMLKDEEINREYKKYGKLENDPRITKVGKFLRKTSLDEFPQFFNILKNDMSLIGPRPWMPGELEEITESRLLWKIKPGLTSWWGCNGRSDCDYKERVELDEYYTKQYSLSLDILCILKTIKAIIFKKGAK